MDEAESGLNPSTTKMAAFEEEMMVMTMPMTLSFYVTVAASLFPMTLTFLSFRVAASLDWNGNVLRIHAQSPVY